MKKKVSKGIENARKNQRKLLQSLKKEESYSPLFAEQAGIAGVIGEVFWRMSEEVLEDNVEYVETTTSREGDTRYKQNPKFQLFIQVLDRYQDALKALGMNVDSKPVKKKEKGINDFLESFKEDND